ncbi:MAG: hypothetical protein CMJ78_10240 [Planctomycetaceae bacterium]|nr:hypothetical protein [Planctomycetaceae bacterium]
MNYFTHGMNYLDRPYFLAGTAVPDWLSVADRKTRMRSRRVSPFADGSKSDHAELAAGVLQHLDDDGWFHQTRAFHDTTTELAVLFREVLGRDDGFRPGFLGHICMEIILDGILIERDPSVLDRYYEVLETVDAAKVQCYVNLMARDESQRLADFVDIFRREKFLYDYLDSNRLLFRLNQVMRRVKLPLLPPEIEDVLISGWSIVKGRSESLLSCENSSDA